MKQEETMANIKFEPNVPVTLAFTYDAGKEVEGNYGPQFMRKTASGDTVYLEPILEKQLVAMGYKKGQQVILCKSVTSAGNGKRRVTWSAEWPAQSPERPLAGQPATPSAAPAANGKVPHFMAEVLINCAKAAIDCALEANAYAAKLRYPLKFEEEDVRAWTCTLYIQHSKQFNISTMHRNEELRDTVRRETTAKPNEDPQQPSRADIAWGEAIQHLEDASQRRVARKPTPQSNVSDADEGPQQPPRADIAWGVTDADVPF
jgi:hypothetical protein